ncbi:hypothetical protein K7W03_25480 [Sphingobium sp. PNB]|uniref:hypothetical protein n=1 Tax=Sphingobium sp. PNB TaxID=863934 RepID=UPI001CA423A3|nr:hypothetical protein [Sphingobium sp. PNB]MCB4862938.1 hypothetical protein [Sphingobium sp. PNB]
MADKKDPPIIEQEYLYGLKVVDIGDIRVARGLSRRPHSSCGHRAMAYDQNERRIWCKDCETDVDPFDAFLIICQHFHKASDRLKRERKAIEEAQGHNIIRIAAKQMDEHFRRKNMVPACPHCHAGIFPEDVPKMGSVNRRWEEAKRARKAKP